MPVNRQSGFTLIELLIACSLLAVLGLASSLIMNAGFITEAQVKDKSRRLNAIDRAVLIVERDLVQMLPLAHADTENQNEVRAIWAWKSEQELDGRLLGFVRQGDGFWVTETPFITYVRYRVEDNELIREQLIRENQQGWQSQVLLSNVNTVELSYYRQDWQQDWQLNAMNPSELPRAIRFEIEIPEWGVLPFIFNTGTDNG